MIGFIGIGNMGGAILKGMINSNTVQASNIYVFDVDKTKMEDLKKEYNINMIENTSKLVETCNIMILAVKPHICEKVLGEIKQCIKPKQILISIAAGWSTAKLRVALEHKGKVISVMPNTPAIVGAGVIALSKDHDLDISELEEVKALLKGNGLVVMVEEEKMAATTGISGTMPACVAMYIEALTDAGVSNGLSRDFALQIAAQTVMGTAKMVLETKTHPAILKDQVCTPAGITIEAVVALEEDGFRGTVIRSVNRCTQKCLDMLK
ncbi:pyrroline-5-carboxylate reductase [Candidatus Epulonipiscium fishelsonii]|uniref:Pyrroline-5-carboxylate reductase n=2 Tax=Candidatus Epulonipiscium fishelsonii TaxID=77094 RepID=A0ACC8XIW9_9FIRM|nr:pyrroline-5-carboxylate reductase [Epulopiscium sp. SCG-D08WGA-EpuloA1]ONI46023.1 pyrroline-5-carboxylate reductase [Epulopiscium sp. SCG-D08WGA-EpuloA1]